MVKLVVCGIGPGAFDLITIRALKQMEQADMLLVPQVVKKNGELGERGLAYDLARFHFPQKPLWQLQFLMTRDEQKRDDFLYAQLAEKRTYWEKAKVIAMPVLGDPSLYGTNYWLLSTWRKIENIQVELIPGLSAHSYLAARMGVALAQDEESFFVLAGTESLETLERKLRLAGSAALYKSSALSDEELRILLEKTGPWHLWRGDDLSLPTEHITEGMEGLAHRPYMCTLLLKREERQ